MSLVVEWDRIKVRRMKDGMKTYARVTKKVYRAKEVLLCK
jgi:hypothetical protein